MESKVVEKEAWKMAMDCSLICQDMRTHVVYKTRHAKNLKLTITESPGNQVFQVRATIPRYQLLFPRLPETVIRKGRFLLGV